MFDGNQTSRSPLIVSSALSAAVVGCISTPFDVVKNFRQANVWSNPHATSKQVLQHILQNGGPLALWTAMSTSLLINIPSSVVFFTLFEHLKPSKGPAAAGIYARLAAVCLVSPVECVKTRCQAELGRSSPFAVFSRVLRTEGLSALYRGICPTLLRDIPFSGIYWKMNESIKLYLQRLDEGRCRRSPFFTHFALPFVSGAASSIVAAVCTHPLDVIKTNLQAPPDALILHLRACQRWQRSAVVSRELFYRGGYRAFSVGLGPRIAKIVPSCAIFLGVYEFTKVVLSK